MTDSVLREARETLLASWGEAGVAVISAAARVSPFCGNVKEFLEHCTACGGDWVSMFLSGIRELYPEVYDAIPDNMGKDGFDALDNIRCVMQLCGVNTFVDHCVVK